MPAELLFIIVLLIGIGLVFVGKRVNGKIKAILIVLGVFMMLFAAFGLFTSVL